MSSSSLSLSNSGGGIPVELAHHDSLEWARSSSSHSSSSRAKTEFDLLQTLGRGGFGTTYLVKNKIDSRLYALKSIRLYNNGKSVLREVELLSGIKSEHIVRYYSAWVERGEIVLPQDTKDHACSSNGYALGESYTTTTNSQQQQQPTTTIDNDPVCNLCRLSYKDWEVSFEHWGLIDSVLLPLNLCVECYKQSVPPHVDVSSITIRPQEKLPEYLFLLMEYGGSTLTQQMSRLSDKEKWSIFGQCVEGLAHLHSQGIIHRDVKPDNIFVTENGTVKIGDLGLATTRQLQQSEIQDQSKKDCSNENSSNVGTYLYKAPEVGSGQGYNDKCDVYSLGIVLVELFHKFDTGMERAVVLNNLRQNNHPDENQLLVGLEEWSTAHVKQAKLVKQMIHFNPDKRPSCRQILGYLSSWGIMPIPPPASAGTANVIYNLQARVQDLEERLRQKENEASKLKLLLQENGISYNGQQ